MCWSLEAEAEEEGGVYIGSIDVGMFRSEKKTTETAWKY